MSMSFMAIPVVGLRKLAARQVDLIATLGVMSGLAGRRRDVRRREALPLAQPGSLRRVLPQRRAEVGALLLIAPLERAGRRGDPDPPVAPPVRRVDGEAD